MKISKTNMYCGAVKLLYSSPKCQVLSFCSVATTEKYEGSDVAWLVEAPEAEIKSFHTRSEPYLGPRI